MSLEKRLGEIAASHATLAAQVERSRVKRDKLIRHAHAEGMGYGTIAKLARLSRSAVQQICNAKTPSR